MKYVIQNQYVKVTLESLGAELKSIENADGLEYLWQGDPAYWKGQAPNLFPYIGRMTNDQYVSDGVTYDMQRHGFAKVSEFQVEEQEAEKIVFVLEETEETLAQYPFAFKFTVIYGLDKNKINVEYKVENKNDNTMYFAVGGHPGFNVPMGEGGFEDCFLEFQEKCNPVQVQFTDTCFISGERTPFSLEEGRKLPLQHGLFDRDAIVLTDVSSVVTIKSKVGKESLSVGYPDMKYIGFWHMPLTEAPYVCIEPWSTLPSRQDVVEDLSKQPDMLALEEQGIYSNKWWIEVN